MTTTCPEGHPTSGADPYCDVCGAALGAQAAPAVPAPAPAVETCASCGAVRYGRFCEECGHDAAVPVDPRRPATAAPRGSGPWTAVVRADREWFEEVRARNGPDAGGLEFPAFCPERRFVLSGAQVQIGRRSRSRGVDPEIDLSGPPMDPGVSTLHALLVPGPDGWQVVDLESTNGTVIGDDPTLIRPNTPIPLADGAVLKIGAWTTVTITQST